jgi:hypothetical protein
MYAKPQTVDCIGAVLVQGAEWSKTWWRSARSMRHTHSDPFCGATATPLLGFCLCVCVFACVVSQKPLSVRIITVYSTHQHLFTILTECEGVLAAHPLTRTLTSTYPNPPKSETLAEWMEDGLGCSLRRPADAQMDQTVNEPNRISGRSNPTNRASMIPR